MCAGICLKHSRWCIAEASLQLSCSRFLASELRSNDEGQMNVKLMCFATDLTLILFFSQISDQK